jgi:hypothetical protein
LVLCWERGRKWRWSRSGCEITTARSKSASNCKKRSAGNYRHHCCPRSAVSLRSSTRDTSTQ